MISRDNDSGGNRFGRLRLIEGNKFDDRLKLR